MDFLKLLIIDISIRWDINTILGVWDMNEDLLYILICPISRQKLEYDKGKNKLIRQEGGYTYKIENNISIILPKQAIKL